MFNQLLSSCYILGLLLAISASAPGQDYVGVLPEMLKPDVSEKLGLSDEQKEKLQALMRTRMSAAIGLSQALREAPTEQHDQLRADFNSESERMAFGLLDQEQQKVLAKYRVGWLGLLSLADEQVAQGLNLADWQKELVAEWVKKVRANRRGPEASKTRADAERSIRQEISESQWAAWQVLAGQIDASTAGPPMPPERVAEAAQPQVAVSNNEAPAQPAPPIDVAQLPVEQITVEMNFQSQPWKDVIKWLAEQADLSLQDDTPLPGSFTYRDRSRKYTIPQAMDVMNATLLNTGYTLFRQGRMLRVIDFEKDQEKSGELLQELADYVDEAELARRGQYEPVKHMFTLERLDPDTIKNEAEQLRSIYGTVRSLPFSRQLLVIDMAANVRAIAEMIRRAELSGASTVQIFSLKAITAEEVLAVARPLLGLEPEVNTSEEIKISTNAFGSIVFVSGKPDKIQILKDLIEQMDVPPSETETTIGQIEQLELLKHKVVGIDMQLAYEIVSQLLAGSPDVKLAQDAVAKQLVLQARPSEHKLVRETLAELAGDSSDFVVIQLKRLDPTLAIAAIKKFFNLPDTPAADSGGPVIDGDLLARQVWVKGSSSEVEQIRKLIEKLEETATSSNPYGDTIRMIPLTGASAQQTLEQMEQLWGIRNGGANPIRVLTPSISSSSSTGNSLPQRTYSQALPNPRRAAPSLPTQQQPATESAPEPTAGESTSDKADAPAQAAPSQTQRLPAQTIPAGRLTAFPQQEPSASDTGSPSDAAANMENMQQRIRAGDIVIMQGPSGLIIQCEDEAVLAEFEGLLRLLADQSAMGSSEPTVVYLRNRKAEAAKELLETILSGTSSSTGSSGGLLGDMAGAVLGGFGGGMFGSMLGGGGSDLMSAGAGIATGDVTIIADPWLNALVIKASPVDMRLIEQLLTVIDQAEGPLTIETQGQLAMIPVISQDVNQMLTTITKLYGDRIEGNSSGGRSSGGGGGGGQPNPADIIAALRGGGGGGGPRGVNSKLVEPKIAISADTTTNTLIVLAQPKQIEEIRQLVADIDLAGEAEKEDFAFASLEGVVSGELMKASVARILGPKAITNTTPTTSPPSGSSSPGGSGGDSGSRGDDAASQARRAEFFEAMRSRMGGGDSGRGGGDSGRGGGSPFGGGGSPFGGRGGGGGGGGDTGGRRGGN
jgi:type II secretory pathway component GspD/PulD (secretin)